MGRLYGSPAVAVSFCLLSGCSAFFSVDRDRLQEEDASVDLGPVGRDAAGADAGAPDDGDGSAGARDGSAGASDACVPAPDGASPSEEQCGNERDDNCNGEVDEGCEASAPFDACPGQVLPLAASEFSVSSPLSPAGHDYPTTCSQGAPPDLVFALPIEARVDLLIDARESPTPVVLAASTTCSAQAFAQACTAREAPARLWVHGVGPEVSDTLYLMVQKRDAGAEDGTVELRLRVMPAKDDTCASPLDITGGGTVVGFLSDSSQPIFGNDFDGSCSPRLGQRQQAIFNVQQTPGSVAALMARSDDFSPQLFGRDRCESALSELFCQASSPSSSSDGSVSVRHTVSPLWSRFSVFVDGGQPGDTYLLRYLVE